MFVPVWVILTTVVGVVMITFFTMVLVAKVRKESRLALISKLEVETEVILNRAINETLCDRALVLKLHNSGGQLYVGKAKKASVLFEGLTQTLPTVKEDFQSQLVDTDYMAIMQRVEREKLIIQNTSKMPHSMLRRIYERDNITITVIFYIKETENGLYYGSFTSKADPLEFMKPSTYSRLENSISRLRVMYEKAHKQKVLH